MKDIELEEDERTDAEEEGYLDGEEDEEEDIDDEEIDLEDMTDEDLKTFIEDVISDMVAAGEIEAGEEFEVEDEVEVDDEVEEGDDIGMNNKSEGSKRAFVPKKNWRISKINK